MRSPSDKRRSARRPGKQERARAKNRLRYGFGIRRGGYWSSAWGAGTVTAYFGRKKQLRNVNVSRGTWGGKPLSHLSGESVDSERRAKALGPHSGQAGVATSPRDTSFNIHKGGET
jgi:hypothetical protein